MIQVKVIFEVDNMAEAMVWAKALHSGTKRVSKLEMEEYVTFHFDRDKDKKGSPDA